MKATAEFICSKCGNCFTIEKGVETAEEKANWEKWAKDTYKNPYCPKCMASKSEELEVMKGNVGGFMTAINRFRK